MFLDTGKIKLYYEKTGTGTPIILLHGNGEDHKTFTQLIQEITAKAAK